MRIITEANDELIIKSKLTGETLETLTGKQIGESSFVAFTRQGMYWAWAVYDYDAPIVNGVVFPSTGHLKTVNPEGFIYNDEIYKIKVAIT